MAMPIQYCTALPIDGAIRPKRISTGWRRYWQMVPWLARGGSFNWVPGHRRSDPNQPLWAGNALGREGCGGASDKETAALCAGLLPARTLRFVAHVAPFHLLPEPAVPCRPPNSIRLPGVLAGITIRRVFARGKV
jgi:hypothetical protein